MDDTQGSRAMNNVSTWILVCTLAFQYIINFFSEKNMSGKLAKQPKAEY